MIPSRVLLCGATGTIGRATASELLRCEHSLTCALRSPARRLPAELQGRCQSVYADFQSGGETFQRLFAGGGFDVVISCMASRTGVAEDAWAVDYQAHSHLLRAAQAAGVKHLVLLSAICVQKPRLAFQHAKLAFEHELRRSGLRYSIVRPTAYFKSLSGQVQRVLQGRSYVMFGDGRQTACKPISDRDLASYLVACLQDEARWNKVLPIGGPGPAMTPREQGEKLFELCAKPARWTRVSPQMLKVIGGGLAMAARAIPQLQSKAELARIGHYYATESMLLWDAKTQQYDAAATPSTGRDTLFDYYAQLIAGGGHVERGAHTVF